MQVSSGGNLPQADVYKKGESNQDSSMKGAEASEEDDLDDLLDSWSHITFNHSINFINGTSNPELELMMELSNGALSE